MNTGKMKRNYSQLDGEVQHYDIMTGISNVCDNPNENGVLYPFDGEKMSYGIGDWWDKQKEKAEARKGKRDERKDTRTSSKAEARSTRSQAKLAQAEAQKEIAKSMSTPDPALAFLTQQGAKPVKTGMSSGAKIGIVLGIAAVVGIIGFVVYKKMKKK